MLIGCKVGALNCYYCCMEQNTLIRFLKCESSTEEENSVMDWVNANPNNRKQFEDLRKIFNAVVLNTEIEVKQSTIAARKPRVRVSHVIAFAATIAALAFVAAYSIFSHRISSLLTQTMSISVPVGQRMNVLLPDSTNVWLSGGTTISYPAVFAANTREVRIDGEALFDVRHNPAKPFIVNTFAYSVEVLGTKFDILAIKGDSRFETELLRGSIKAVSNTDKEDFVLMKPNEKVVMESGKLVKHNINSFDDCLWTEGIMSFDGTSFEDFKDKIERLYGYNLILERSTIPVIRYRGKFRISEGISHIMEIVSMNSDFTYRIDNDKLNIYIK